MSQEQRFALPFEIPSSKPLRPEKGTRYRVADPIIQQLNEKKRDIEILVTETWPK